MSKKLYWFICPQCELKGKIDQDQFWGNVSIICPNDNYHDTLKPQVKNKRPACDKNCSGTLGPHSVGLWHDNLCRTWRCNNCGVLYYEKLDTV